jgi:hypothetical protein
MKSHTAGCGKKRRIADFLKIPSALMMPQAAGRVLVNAPTIDTFAGSAINHR